MEVTASGHKCRPTVSFVTDVSSKSKLIPRSESDWNSFNFKWEHLISWLFHASREQLTSFVCSTNSSRNLFSFFPFVTSVPLHNHLFVLFFPDCSSIHFSEQDPVLVEWHRGHNSAPAALPPLLLLGGCEQVWINRHFFSSDRSPPGHPPQTERASLVRQAKVCSRYCNKGHGAGMGRRCDVCFLFCFKFYHGGSSSVP